MTLLIIHHSYFLLIFHIILISSRFAGIAPHLTITVDYGRRRIFSFKEKLLLQGQESNPDSLITIQELTRLVLKHKYINKFSLLIICNIKLVISHMENLSQK